MQTLIIAGIVGKDAVLRRTQGGDAVLNFSLAVDNGKDRNGQKRDATWFDCSVWGERAEKLERHVTKGLRLTLSGGPTARAHEGKVYLGITVHELTFQGGNQRDDRQSGGSDWSAAPASGGSDRSAAPASGGSRYDQSPTGSRQAAPQQRNMSADLDDDIPF